MFKATCVYHRDPFHPARNREIRELTGPAQIKHLAPTTQQPFIILRNGEAVLRADWDQVISNGDLLAVILLPQGGDDGGSNVMQVILMVVVAVAAFYTGGAVGAAYGSGWGAAAQVAVGMVGSMLVNAMLPPPQAAGNNSAADFKAASPTYNLSAQGNTARLEGAIPVQYGRLLAYPDFAAPPYVEYEGNEQYLYQLLCLGVGEFAIEAIRIEDTPIANFEEITYEIVGPNEPLDLFPAAVATAPEVSGQEAFHNNTIGPFASSPEGTLGTKISIDLVCPAGIYYAQDDGSFSTLSISISIEARQIDDLGNPLVGWFPLGLETIAAATNTAQRRTFTYAVSAARYEVRLTRLTAKDASTRAGHSINWTGLRTHLVSSSTFGNVTLLALRMRSTNNLSSQASRKVNVIATRKLPIWNGTTWSAPTATRSIAWAIADACRTVGLPDSRIDLAGLLALDTTWAARGDKFDGRFDSTGTYWDGVSRIGLAGRAKIYMQGGIIHAVRDQQTAVPVALYSMRNIERGSLTLDFITPTDDTADAVELTYFDETAWKPRRLKCKLPDSSAVRPAKVELFGVINRQQAFQEGTYMAAANRYRRTLIKFNTEMEGFIPSYGDLVAIQHDVPQWGQVGDAVTWNAGTRALSVSEPLEWAEAGTHYIGLRRRDGSLSGPYQVSAGTADNEVILTADPEFTPYTGSDEERTHVVFGLGSEWRRLARVIAVRPRDMTKVELTCINEDPLVHSADQVSGPPLPEVWALPSIPKRPILAAIYVNQSGNPAAPVITVSWPAAAGAEFYVVESSSNAIDWQRAGESAGASVSFSVPPGPLHIRARAFNSLPGPWVSWSGVAGEVPVPGRPQGLALVEAWLSNRARWQWGAAARAASYEVEIYAAAVLRRSFETAALTYEYDADQIIADGGPWRSVEIKVRAKGPTGVSDWASLTSVNPQVGTLSGVVFVPGYLQIIGTYGLPADTDFAGVRVALSTTSGFDQSAPETIAYDGYDQIFVLTGAPGGAPFADGEIWYIRIAGYDAFGKDDLQWSAEHQVTIAGVDASLTPEEVLASLNASFVQGNVVLAGSGAVTVYNGPPSTPNRDFVLLSAGTISFQRYRNGQYREYKSLKRVESGSAPSGQTVTLPGWWDRQPRVTVSPQSLMSYRTGYSAQDQTWACRADNLREDPAASGIWKFDAVAELQLSSASGTTSINQATGDTSSNAWDSSIYFLPANTRDITVNVSVKSKRGTGAHTAEWAYRYVTATVYAYSVALGWVSRGSVNIFPGTILDGFLTGSIGCYALPSGTDRFYVHYVAGDNGGVFSTGGDVYNYTSATVTAPGPVTASDNSTAGAPNVTQLPLPGYTPPTGWTVYQVNYNYEYRYTTESGRGTISYPNQSFSSGGGASYTAWAAAPTIVEGSFNPSRLYVQASYTSSFTGLSVKGDIRNGSATIYMYQLIPNSASQINAFTLTSYSWQVASASALAVGSINYMAVGD